VINNKIYFYLIVFTNFLYVLKAGLPDTRKEVLVFTDCVDALIWNPENTGFGGMSCWSLSIDSISYNDILSFVIERDLDIRVGTFWDVERFLRFGNSLIVGF